MTKYSAFYNAIRLGEPVEADVAVEVTDLEVRESLFPYLKEHREYLGLIDAEGTTFQMLYDAEEDKFWAEVPRPDLGGAFGAKLDYETMHNLIYSLPALFPIEGFAGFNFERWPS